jgi:serine protease Do
MAVWYPLALSRSLPVVLGGLLVLGGCATKSRSSSRAEVIKQILPSTVQLRCERDSGDRRAASGVVLARDVSRRRTWIVTTRHFVEPVTPQKLYVTFAGAKARSAAKLVKLSEGSDLALLEVEGLEAAPVRLKDSVALGDEVWVVAYPWGRRMTLSNGVISQIVRDDADTVYEGPARMVDVSVSYGASGGGVFDVTTGALVGLVEGYRTAKMTPKATPDSVIEIPIAGETTLISAEAIRRFVVEAGLGSFLER